jgi:hypothetical protein
MTELKLRNLISVFLIVAHVVIFGLIVLLRLLHGLTTTEFSTAVSIIAPMLGAATGLAISYVIGAKKKPRKSAASPELSGVYVFTALFLPVLFVLAIAGIVILTATGFTSFEEFKAALAAVETIFGAYTGRMLASLFEKGQPR